LGAYVYSIANYYLGKKSRLQSSQTQLRYLEAPNEAPVPTPSLFLGGGISGCSDWHQEIRRQLQTTCPNLFLVNPKRVNFDITDKDATPIQINWEFKKLRECSAVMFYFPSETLCPITLLELGQWLILSKQTGTKVFVQTHPNYARKLDVQIQVKLANDTIDVIVSDNFDKLVEQIHAWYSTQK